MTSRAATHVPTSLENVPVYGLPRAAQILRVAPSTLRLWGLGGTGAKALFEPAESTPLTLSFSNLIEAFMLASMRRVHGISMQRVRKALRFVGNELGVSRPLVDVKFSTDGVRIFVEQADHLLDVSADGQIALRQVLRASLARIDWEHGLAARLYPNVRSGDLDAQPKTIVIDPHRGFGQPTIAGTGVEARIIAQRYRAGDSVKALSEDYGVEADRIEDAIRCETRAAA